MDPEIPIDPDTGEEFQPGDAGYVVVKPDTTVPRPGRWGVKLPT